MEGRAKRPGNRESDFRCPWFCRIAKPRTQALQTLIQGFILVARTATKTHPEIANAISDGHDFAGLQNLGPGTLCINLVYRGAHGTAILRD
jgi:hypothetical protein